MTLVEVIPSPSEALVARVAMEMRGVDRRELRAAGYDNLVGEAMRWCRRSTASWVAFRGERPLAAWGVTPYSIATGTGLPWMFGTDLLEGEAMLFLRVSRSFVWEMLLRHKRLENWVHANNTLAVRWLRWCGFTMEAPKPFGPYGESFCHFTLERQQ